MVLNMAKYMEREVSSNVPEISFIFQGLTIFGTAYFQNQLLIIEERHSSRHKKSLDQFIWRGRFDEILFGANLMLLSSYWNDYDVNKIIEANISLEQEGIMFVERMSFAYLSGANKRIQSEDDYFNSLIEPFLEISFPQPGPTPMREIPIFHP